MPYFSRCGRVTSLSIPPKRAPPMLPQCWPALSNNKPPKYVVAPTIVAVVTKLIQEMFFIGLFLRGTQSRR